MTEMTDGEGNTERIHQPTPGLTADVTVATAAATAAAGSKATSISRSAAVECTLRNTETLADGSTVQFSAALIGLPRGTLRVTVRHDPQVASAKSLDWGRGAPNAQAVVVGESGRGQSHPTEAGVRGGLRGRDDGS